MSQAAFGGFLASPAFNRSVRARAFSARAIGVASSRNTGPLQRSQRIRLPGFTSGPL
jgi:hypothetical protein